MSETILTPKQKVEKSKKQLSEYLSSLNASDALEDMIMTVIDYAFLAGGLDGYESAAKLFKVVASEPDKS